MLKLLYNFPREQHFYLACSGGVDSMAAADFFRRGNKNFTILYFNHGTIQSNEMESFVSSWAISNDVPCEIGRLVDSRPKGISPEEFWRMQRYAFFSKFGQAPIVTCHHLNDVAETWLFTSMHGNPKIIMPKRDNFYRPFLLNEKQKLQDWCEARNIKWVEDTSNQDINFPRNRIRHIILPEVLKINPGLLKVLKKKIVGIANETA